MKNFSYWILKHSTYRAFDIVGRTRAEVVQRFNDIPEDEDRSFEHNSDGKLRVLRAIHNYSDLFDLFKRVRSQKWPTNVFQEISGLSRKARKLILRHAAVYGERAYRRGFQHGVTFKDRYGDSVHDKHVSEWRFSKVDSVWEPSFHEEDEIFETRQQSIFSRITIEDFAEHYFNEAIGLHEFYKEED